MTCTIIYLEFKGHENINCVSFTIRSCGENVLRNHLKHLKNTFEVYVFFYVMHLFPGNLAAVRERREKRYKGEVLLQRPRSGLEDNLYRHIRNDV